MIGAKHDIPTPPVGYWAKLAHGKPVDQLPLPAGGNAGAIVCIPVRSGAVTVSSASMAEDAIPADQPGFPPIVVPRSEEHTSELQSLMRISYAVFCLKKQQTLNLTM